MITGDDHEYNGGLTKEETLKNEIISVINRYSRENNSNTPDWILGNYLMNCLVAFEQGVQQRETWYGRDARPSAPPVAEPKPQCSQCQEDEAKLTKCPKGGEVVCFSCADDHADWGCPIAKQEE